ncbi:MAG TPA: alpha/beta hydrolase [Candidatus Kapabacteria bacterium]|nr:alpha/beta hydrolase [Candidatus Kapabacteria bacterium]
MPLLALSQVAFGKPTSAELMRGTMTFAKLWREASLPQNRGTPEDVIATYQRVLDTSLLIDSPFEKWYVAMSHFGIARSQARLRNIDAAKEHIGEAVTNDFWNIHAMYADPVLRDAVGALYLDSLETALHARAAAESSSWRRQPLVVFGPKEGMEWAKLGKLDSWFNDDETRANKLDSMYSARWQELTNKLRSDSTKPNVIIALHGGNASYREFGSHWAMVGQMTNSYIIVPPGINRFSRTVNGWEAEYESMDEYLLKIVEQLRDDQGMMPNIYVAGYSQGACLAMKFALVHPDLVRGAISFAGFMDGPVDQELVARAQTAGLKIYAESGEFDSESFRRSLSEMKAQFDRGGVAFQYTVSEKMIHEMPQPFWQHFLKAWKFVRSTT